MGLTISFWPRDTLSQQTTAEKEFMKCLQLSGGKAFTFKGYTFHPQGDATACIKIHKIPLEVPTVFTTSLSLGLVIIEATVLAQRGPTLGQFISHDKLAGGHVTQGLTRDRTDIVVSSGEFKAAIKLFDGIKNRSIEPLPSSS